MSDDKPAPARKTAKKAVAFTQTAKPKTPATGAIAKGAAGSKRGDAAAVPAQAISKPLSASKAATTNRSARTAASAAKSAGLKGAAPPAKTLIEKPAEPSKEERQRWIAIAAYHRAEKRGFAPGYEVQDWLDAEAEVGELVGPAKSK